MKTIRKIFIITFLMVIFIYVTDISNIPSDVILFKGEELNLHLVLGLKIDNFSKLTERL